MNRRRFLATAGSVGTLATAGCLDRISGDGQRIPDGMTVETHHTNDIVLRDTAQFHEDINSYHLLITDRSSAQDRFAPEEPGSDMPPADADAIAFIEDTDFNQSYIVIVQYGMQSLRWLELSSIDRSGDGGILVSVETDDDGYNDDWTVHSKIIRITDEAEDIPVEVVAEVDGESTAFDEVAER